MLTKKQQKKAKKKLAKGGGTREGALQIYGANALASFRLLTEPLPKAKSQHGPPSSSTRAAENPRCLLLTEVQNLVLWSLTNELGEMPRWICIRNKPLLRGAVVVLTRQLSAQAAEAALAPLVAPTGDVGDVPAQASDPATSDRHGFARTFTSPKLVKMPRAHHTRMTLAVEGELFSVKLPRKRKAAALEAAAAGGGTGLSPSAPDPASSAGFVAPSRVATARSDESSKVRWHPSYVRSFAARGGELRENDYPISGDGHLAATYLPAALPMDGLDASAVKASPGVGAAVDAATRLLAIDCEMVLVRGTTMVDGGWPLVKQLARVAVVDEEGSTLLDELVIPERPVVDYLTRYSGMSRELLETASLTFDEVRSRVRELIGAGAANVALVGHSLECDLHALRLTVPTHGGPMVLDTSLLYPLRCHHNGPPSKAALRNLTVTHLKREIQQSKDHAVAPGAAGGGGGKPGRSGGAPMGSGGGGGGGVTTEAGHGHSPVEDALAALELARLKLTRGHAYGTPHASWGVGCEALPQVLRRAGWTSVSIRSGSDCDDLDLLPTSLASNGTQCDGNGNGCASVQGVATSGNESIGDATSGGGGGSALDAAIAAHTAAEAAEAAKAADSLPQRYIPCANDDEAVRATVEVSAADGAACHFVWTNLSGEGDEEQGAARLQMLAQSLPANTMLIALGMRDGPTQTAAETPAQEAAAGTAVVGIAEAAGDEDEDGDEVEMDATEAAEATDEGVGRRKKMRGAKPPPGWVICGVTPGSRGSEQ